MRPLTIPTRVVIASSFLFCLVRKENSSWEEFFGWTIRSPNAKAWTTITGHLILYYGSVSRVTCAMLSITIIWRPFSNEKFLGVSITVWTLFSLLQYRWLENPRKHKLSCVDWSLKTAGKYVDERNNVQRPFQWKMTTIWGATHLHDDPFFIHGNQSVCNLSKYIYCSYSWEKYFFILFLYSISSRCICNGERKTFRTVFLYICCVLWTRYKSSQVWARLTFMTASSPIQLNNFQD